MVRVAPPASPAPPPAERPAGPAPVLLGFLAPGEAELLRSGRVPAHLEAHAEYPMESSLDTAGVHLQVVCTLGDPGPWGAAWILLPPAGPGSRPTVVGDAGFHGAPDLSGDPRTVEIGYAVVPALRRRGIATAAGRLLLEHAWRHGADVVRADTAAGNLASQRVLRRLGFTALGPDRTGDLVFERRRPEAAA